MHLCAWEGKVPVTGEGLGGREGDVAVVDGSDTEKDVTGKNDASEPYYPREVVRKLAVG